MPRNTWWSRRRAVFQQDSPVADGIHAHSAPPNKKKQHAVAGLSEFVGTLLFLFFAYGGTNVAMESPGEVTDPVPRLLYISLAFGISLLVNVWAFFRIGGGMFNPAVALGMWIIGAIDIVRLLIVVLAEITGSVAAAALIDGLIPGPLVVSTELADGVSIAQGLFLEAFLTTELVFVIFMLANERHRATFLAPVGIGLALFICELMGVRYTGGSLNPARSFGPSIVVGFVPYHWIYWVGPMIGTLLATALYTLTKALDARRQTGDVDDPALPVVHKAEPPIGPAADIEAQHTAHTSAA